MEPLGANDNFLRPEVSDDNTTKVVTLDQTPIHTATACGAAWARKYEHPPAPTAAVYAGIPDINNSPSVCSEYRAVQNIQTVSVIGPTTTYYNKVAFLQLPSVIAPVLAYKYDIAGARVQLPEDVVHNPSIDTRRVLGTAGSARLAYKSVTYDLNATDFNNQGTVTVAQFRPNVATYSTALLLERIKTHAPK